MSRARLGFFLSLIFIYSLFSTLIRIFLNMEGVFQNVFENIRFHTQRILIVFAHPHEKAKTMEIRQHTLEGMGRMMYNVIIFQDLRFGPSTLKRLVSVFKIFTLGTVFKTSVFDAQIHHAQKLRLLLDFPVKIAEFWPRSIYY